MYVDPFVAGVVATILIELVVAIIAAGISTTLDKKKGKQ